MRYLIPKVVLLGLMSSSVGCALCSSPYDYDYVTYGGKTPRDNMRCGRVGSPFSDARVAGLSEDFQVLEGETIEEGEVLEDTIDQPIDDSEAEIMMLPDTALLEDGELEPMESELIDEVPVIQVAQNKSQKSSRGSLSDSQVQQASAVRALPKTNNTAIVAVILCSTNKIGSSISRRICFSTGIETVKGWGKVGSYELRQWVLLLLMLNHRYYSCSKECSLSTSTISLMTSTNLDRTT